MKRSILKKDKGNIVYFVSENWKADADTLFFMHGLTADHTMFDEQIRYFEKKYNIITWDAPAHGQSRPFGTYTFKETSVYIQEILDSLKVSKAVLIGQSLGGYFAQSFIKYFPGYVKAFVSIDSTPYGSGYYSKPDVWILKRVETLAKMYPLGIMKIAIAKQVSTTRRAYENMLQMLEPYGKKEICHLMGFAYAGFLEENCDLEITCPVLLILGEKDITGKVIQYNIAWTKRTGFPLKIIRGAAHNSNVDRPKEVNNCIRKFLSKLEIQKL